MKSKFTLLVVCFFISFKLFSQTALPNGMVYYFLEYQDDAGIRYYFSRTDTVRLDSSVNGANYYRFSSSRHTKLMVHKHRFYYQTHPDSSFSLIYDFNLKAGDYMKGYSYIDSLRIDSVQNEVIGKDSFIIQYVTVTKALSLYPRNFRFVNRIGSLEAGIAYWEHFFFEHGNNLLGLCNQNEALQWQSQPLLHFSKRASCNSMDSILHTISVKAINKNPKVFLSPNPVSKQLSIETLQANEPLSIAIYNALGALVYQTKCTDKMNTIDMHGFENGLYIVKITMGDNQFSTHKIFKQ